MSQYHLVCKKRVNGSKCSTTISADTKDELLEAALNHAFSVHGLPRTRGLIDGYRNSTKKGGPRS